ncbi:MAG TPA: hypothetical protein VF128_09045 [Gemmatimonadaceae bacterium]
MRRGLGRFVAVFVVAAACIDLSTDPDEIVAIEFQELPWPSIVAGDTLRDATGAVAPLTVRLLGGDGDEITGPVEFLTQQSSIHVTAGGLLVADDTATGVAGIIASTTGIQSVVRQIDIVAAPDSMAANGAVTTLAWVVPDDPAINTSQPLSVRVLSAPNAGVPSWIVTFQLEAGGRQIAESDTTQIYLVGENGKPSYADTTDQTGGASRRVRLKVAPGLIPPDSAVVTVRASYKGVPLIGSPVRLVLPLRAG